MPFSPGEVIIFPPVLRGIVLPDFSAERKNLH
jgi:hypothetical protein